VEAGYGSLISLKRFVTTISARYRTQRIRVGQDEITDQRLLAAIIGVDKEMVRVSEQICEVTVGCSAFDKPGRWGAGRGRKEEVADVFQRLELRENRHKRRKLQKWKIGWPNEALTELASCVGCVRDAEGARRAVRRRDNDAGRKAAGAHTGAGAEGERALLLSRFSRRCLMKPLNWTVI